MRVGLVDCGLPLCRTTWTHAQFSWEIDPRVRSRATTLPECPSPTVSYESVAKSPVKLLESNAVDLLLVDHSRHDRAASSINRERRGTRLARQSGSLTQLLLVLWKSGVNETSPRLLDCPGSRTGERLHPTVYVSQHQFVRAQEVRGSVKHARMVVIHTKLRLALACRDMSGGWDPSPTSRLPRPISKPAKTSWTRPPGQLEYDSVDYRSTGSWKGSDTSSYWYLDLRRGTCPEASHGGVSQRAWRAEELVCLGYFGNLACTFMFGWAIFSPAPMRIPTTIPTIMKPRFFRSEPCSGPRSLPTFYRVLDPLPAWSRIFDGVCCIAQSGECKLSRFDLR
jgi:hypothetical protein